MGEVAGLTIIDAQVYHYTDHQNEISYFLTCTEW